MFCHQQDRRQKPLAVFWQNLSDLLSKLKAIIWHYVFIQLDFRLDKYKGSAPTSCISSKLVGPLPEHQRSEESGDYVAMYYFKQIGGAFAGAPKIWRQQWLRSNVLLSHWIIIYRHISMDLNQHQINLFGELLVKIRE